MVDAVTSEPQPGRYLEDITVGQRFISGTHVVDEKQIISFAFQFDPQPFHTDPRAAKRTFFEGLVASGWYTAAISMRLLLDAFPIAGGTIGLGGEATWPRPVKPLDVLHVEGEIMNIKPSRSRDDRGVVSLRMDTKNQLDEKVQILTSKLLVFRRGRDPAQTE